MEVWSYVLVRLCAAVHYLETAELRRCLRWHLGVQTVAGSRLHCSNFGLVGCVLAVRSMVS